MEDEDDSYGFGSYSDLFDGAPGSSHAPSALDVEALRRLWMPERLLAQVQHRRDGEGIKEFQHIGAKVDGRAVDGGLGRLRFVHPRDAPGGGVMWLQAAKSDSNAQDKRRELLAAEKRSSSALFVPFGDIARASATSIQNTVQGIELALADGHFLQLAFLPGPFFSASHRDEFLATINERLRSQAGDRDEFLATINERLRSQAGDDRARSNRTASPTGDDGETRRVLDAEGEGKPAELDAAVVVAIGQDTSDRDAMRALVRRYSQLDEFSDEAIQLARQVHEATGYHLGPLAKKFPRFFADATYRKQAVQELSEFLKTMGEEWARADAQRELKTNTRSFRNQDELFQYTDAATGEGVSPRSYEARYAQFARLEDSDPVIRCFSSREASSDGAETTELYKAELSVLLGVDVSASCIIDELFFKDDPTDGDSQQSLGRWQLWKAAFADYIKHRNVIAEDTAGSETKAKMPTATWPSSPGARKRPRDRRRSIVPANEVAALNELVASPSVSSVRSENASEPSSSHGKRRRRSSSPSPELLAVDHQRAKRKSRRQSITGAVDTSLLAGGEDAAALMPVRSPHGTPAASRLDHATDAADLEAESKGGEEAEVLCQLCFSEAADVEMDPCHHRVCATCWDRLAPGGGGSGEGQGEHMCPWDRERVFRR